MFILQIRRQTSLIAHGTMRLSNAIQEYVDGLKFLVHHPDIFAIALHKPALTILFGTTFRVVQTAIAERVFPYGEQGAMSMGIMMGVAGIGTGIGPLVARRFTQDHQTRLRWAMLGGYAMGATGLIISSLLNSLPTVLCGAFLSGAGNGILWVFSTQLILLNAPAHIRGRVFGSEFAMFALASSVGSAAVGWAMDTELGIAGVLRVMAMCAAIPAVAWLRWTTKRV
jgi:MFS family permease